MQYLQEKKPSGQLLWLAILMISGMVIASGITFFAGTSTVAMMISQTVSQLLMFLVPALVVTLVFTPGGRQRMQLRYNGYWPIGAVALVCCIPLCEMVQQWNEGWHFAAPFEALEQALRAITEQSNNILRDWMDRKGAGAMVGNLIVIALVPALCEEFFFRGCLQQILCQWTRRPWAAIVLTAIIFSLAHGDIFGFFPRMILGVVLGLLFYLSGSIWTNVAAHFVNNALAVYTYMVMGDTHKIFETEDLMLELMSVVLSTTLGLLLIIWIGIRAKKRKSATQIADNHTLSEENIEKNTKNIQ